MREVALEFTHRTIFSLEKLEILKQRNSRHRKCSKDIDNYDKTVVDEVLHKTGCRPPYIKSPQSYPKCKTQKDIKKGRIDVLAQKQVGIPKACQRISKNKIDINQHDDPFFNVCQLRLNILKKSKS